MQKEEEPPGYSPSGHVHEIRRQWAVHEDEALAYRLQNEEITQHYSGNRYRNAIVREDVPKAREEQLREEQEALEERFQQLQLLQQQAQDDELLAKQLAERYKMDMEADSLLDNPAGAGAVAPHSVVNGASSGGLPSSSRNSNNASNPPDEKRIDSSPVAVGGPTQISTLVHCHSLGSSSKEEEKKVKSIMKPASSGSSSSRKEFFTPLLLGAGAAGPSSSSSSQSAAAASSSSISAEASASRISPPLAIALAINPELSGSDLPSCKRRLQEEEAKLLQEKLDEVIAFKLQKQLEQMEIDAAKRIEAEDRELAKSIHQKEKERLRRAKERAKLKAAAAMLSSSSPEQSRSPNHESSSSSVPGSSGSHHHLTSSSSSSDHGNEMAGTSSSACGSSSRSTHSSSSRGCSVSIGDGKCPSSSSWTFDNDTNPPNIPEKIRLDKDDPVRFRAASKPLPPNPRAAQQPPSESRRLLPRNGSSSSSSHYQDFTPAEEPPPCYMPLQGLQNLHKKRNK